MSREATEPGREERFHAVLAQYLQLVESKRAPNKQDFMAHHAEFAQELGQFFADSAWFDTAARPLQTWCHAPVRDTPEMNAPSALGGDDVPATTSRESATEVPGAATRRVGNYELLEEIGRGGMGVVYRATQLDLRRIVAVKMILSGRFASQKEVDRFHRGAEAAAHLRHGNIAQIHEVGEHEGLHYISMDYVEGSSLAEWVRAEGPLPPMRAARYIQKTAQAMDYAHERGTYHRDLKPANVLIDEHDEPQVTDFGLAKRLDGDPEITQDTDLLGTASYMSPEQAAQRFKEVGAASDIYSLGATLYYLLTGHPPFQGATPADTLYQVIHNDPIPPRDFHRKISRDLEAIVLKCLEKSPQRRYVTAAALAEDLDRFLHDEPVHRPRRRLVRTLHWMRGVPLVARLAGRAFHQPSSGQRWAQRGINYFCLVALMAMAMTFLWSIAFPKPIRLLGGLPGPGYCYDTIVRWLAPQLENTLGRPVAIVSTGGSNDNVRDLQEGKADLAVTHLGANRLQEKEVPIVAPLYYGVVYVVVRESSNIHQITDFRGKRISLGPPSLGMRDAAAKVLLAHEVNVTDLDQDTVDLPFEKILQDATIDGAIITTGREHPDLERAFTQGFKALSLPEARALSAEREQFRMETVEVPVHGTMITTVQSTIVLVAAEDDTPDAWITAALESLYSATPAPPLPFLMSRQEATVWVNEVDFGMHPVAKRFFQTSAAHTQAR
ncbi:MAG: serine/threonine-protein kinase [Pirellulaceae bacterium]